MIYTLNDQAVYTGDPMTKIYAGEAIKELGMCRRTFKKYVKLKVFKTVEVDKNGFPIFSKEQLLKAKKGMRTDRKKGYPLFIVKKSAEKS